VIATPIVGRLLEEEEAPPLACISKKLRNRFVSEANLEGPEGRLA
jgi:hypothetical protein